MSDDKKGRSVSLSQGGQGFFGGLSRQIRLILRLMGDSRVNPLIKILPLGTLVYLIFPDLVPGPVDDALVIGLGTYFFIELCPTDVVEEHRALLAGESDSGDVVDAEFTGQSDDN